jgi:hypothetical protein
VPDDGVPNALLTQFDIVERGRKLLAHLQPHVYAPGIVPVSDNQLLEGMTDSGTALPRQDCDVMKLIAGWRRAATKQGEAALQFFLTPRRIPLPLSQLIVSNAWKVIELLDGS